MKIGIGKIAGIVAFFGAILMGVLMHFNVFSGDLATAMPWVLVLAGVIVGLVNIQSSEAMAVLIIAVLFSVAGGVMIMLPMVGGLLESVVGYIALVSIAVAVPPGLKLAWAKWGK